MPNHSVAVGGQHVLSLVLLTTLDEAVWDRTFELRADLRYGRLGTGEGQRSSRQDAAAALRDARAAARTPGK